MTYVFTARGAVVRRTVLAAITREVPALTPDLHTVFSAAFRDGPPPELKVLAADLSVAPPTLISRFYRAGLRSPKTYLRWSGLLRLADAWDCGGLTRPQAAFLAGVHSEPTLSRWLGRNFGLTTPATRALGCSGVLERFLGVAIRPYREALSHARPLTQVAEADGRRRHAHGLGRAA